MREEDVHYQNCPKSQCKGAWREKEMKSGRRHGPMAVTFAVALVRERYDTAVAVSLEDYYLIAF